MPPYQVRGRLLSIESSLNDKSGMSVRPEDGTEKDIYKQTLIRKKKNPFPLFYGRFPWTCIPGVVKRRIISIGGWALRRLEGIKKAVRRDYPYSLFYQRPFRPDFRDRHASLNESLLLQLLHFYPHVRLDPFNLIPELLGDCLRLGRIADNMGSQHQNQLTFAIY